MRIADSNVLVTGSNRGLGLALVKGLLARGARRVYAASRTGDTPRDTDADRRLIPITLDITDGDGVARLAQAVEDLSVLINNAGTLASFSALADPIARIRRDMDTNFFGPLQISRTLAPMLERHGGAIVNVLSVAALASMPALGGYSASKAAALSLTQALRGELRPRGIRVISVFPGPIDTDMIRSFEMPKTSAADVAASILDGLERDEEDIAPDPMSKDVLERWRRDPKGIEQRFRGM
jgi:NAD(P)-dependent dehydrogenase (short-subunit alcohol dehydrogenase family)